MTQEDKTALAGRLDKIGLVTPTLDQAQPGTVRDIGTITGEILEAKRVGGEAIITIGQRLIEAKALLSDEKWLYWLSEKVDFSPRSAQRFMKLAREWSDATALSHLGATKALQLLALPESEREEFLSETHQVNGEEKTVIDMTSRELEKAIRERDEARKAAERAQADAKAAAEARRSMEDSLKNANALLDSAKLDLDQTRVRESALLEQLKKRQAAPVEVAVMEADQEKLAQARAEGEAARAAELAELQAKYDKAREARKQADEKRKNAEAAAGVLKLQLEAASKAQAQASALSDPEVAKFEVYFNQAQETVNKMRGILLKVRGRDGEAAGKLSRAILALSDAVKGAAE